jgi:hypothetical protein
LKNQKKIGKAYVKRISGNDENIATEQSEFLNLSLPGIKYEDEYSDENLNESFGELIGVNDSFGMDVSASRDHRTKRGARVSKKEENLLIDDDDV